MKALRPERNKIIVIAFFTVFLLYGLLMVKDYGISVDEIYERRSSLVTYQYLIPSVSDIVTDSVDFREVEPLHEWHDRYYGVTLQLPTVVIEHLFGFQLPIGTVLMLRHVYTFLLFFLAAVCFYVISKRLTGNIWLALFGTAIFIVNPRTLADSFYNMKDSLFLSVFTFNLYAALMFMEKPGIKTMFFFSFVSALCSNTRIVGAAAAVVCVFWMGLQCLVEKRKEPVPYMLGGTALCFLFYILLTPVTWTNPVGEILATIEKFSDFPWGGSNFYNGYMVRASELPWHYLPVWMVLTIPVGILALAAIGGIRTLLHPVREWANGFLLFTFLLPVCYVMIARPALYNGWRHFYFVYALVALFAVLGADWIGKKAKKWAAALGAVVILAPVLLWIGKNHPYEYCYFNPGLRAYADTHFEKDYWGVGTYGLLEWILANDDREEGIKTHMFLSWALHKLTPEERSRIEQIEAKGAEHITYNYIASSDMAMQNPYYSNNKEFSIVVDGIEIGSVFWGLWDQNSSFRVTTGKESDFLEYNLNEADWNKEISDGKATLTGMLNQTLVTDWISIEASDERVWKQAEFSYTEDGKEWKTINLETEADIYGEFAHIHLPEKAAILGIRMAYRGDEKKLIWNFNLYGKRYPENDNNASFVEIVATNVDNINAGLAVDNDLWSRWSVNHQEEDIIFAFTMKESVWLSKIELALGEDTYDAPDGVKLYVSDDEETWEELSYETNGVDMSFSPVKCRYVRMILPPDPARVSNWTIREIRLYGGKE